MSACGPIGVVMLIRESPGQAPKFGMPKQAESRAELHTALDWSVETVTTSLRAWGEAGLAAEWRMVDGSRVLVALPRFEMLRSTVLNPDENPFA